VTRQFVGPSSEPDRYELVQLLSTDVDGVERWYATRWRGDHHTPHHLAMVRKPDRAALAVVGVGPTIAAPRTAAGATEWTATESFTGAHPHPWQDAEAATVAWYRVWSRPEPAEVRVIAPPTGGEPASPRPTGAGSGEARRRTIAIATLLAVVVAAVGAAVFATSSRSGESDDARPPATSRPPDVATTLDRTAPTTNAPPTTAAPTATTGPVPARDTVGDSTGADLVSAAAWSDGTNITFEVRFSPESFSEQSKVVIGLDTDQDPLTGHNGEGSICTGASGVGAEFIVDVGGTYRPDEAPISRYDGTCNQFTRGRSGEVTRLADGYRIVVPLIAIADDGALTYDMTSSTELGPGMSTPVQDSMPDYGQPPLATTD
jgi:hypothetical protein